MLISPRRVIVLQSGGVVFVCRIWTHRWLRSNSVPVMADNGNITHVVLFHNDNASVGIFSSSLEIIDT